MDRSQIETLLIEIREGRTAVADALDRLRDLPFEDLGFAKLDHHRALRTGMPEVIFAAGKTPAQVAIIFARMAAAGGNVLATRASLEIYEAVREAEPRAEFHQTARAITLSQSPAASGKGTICVVCAGTSDLPVAEEAVVTARLMGTTVELIADVGVAGIHRLLAQKQSLQSARVLIVCAGMEGAPPSKASVAGAGTGSVPCWQTTVPLPTFRFEASHLSILSSAAPAAEQTISTMVSTAPTSWKCTDSMGMEWMAASASPSS